MKTDRELLELKMKLRISCQAIAEHSAWVDRNTARKELKNRMRAADLQHRGELSAKDWEPEEWAEWQLLIEKEKKAQSTLENRRAATRRAIVRAAAAIGEKEGGSK